MNRQIKEDDLTVTFALYASHYNHINIWRVGSYIDDDPDYVKVSEDVTMTFTALPDEVVLAGRVASIDSQIEEARAELTRKIEGLKDEKQRLLAITHSSTDES